MAELRDALAEIIDPGVMSLPRINLHRKRYEDAWAKADAVRNLVLADLLAALDQIANPIGCMRRRAEAEGGVLNGGVARQIADDPHFLRKIASDALEAWKQSAGATRAQAQTVDLDTFETVLNDVLHDNPEDEPQKVGELYRETFSEAERRVAQKEEPR